MHNIGLYKLKLWQFSGNLAVIAQLLLDFFTFTIPNFWFEKILTPP